MACVHIHIQVANEYCKFCSMEIMPMITHNQCTFNVKNLQNNQLQNIPNQLKYCIATYLRTQIYTIVKQLSAMRITKQAIAIIQQHSIQLTCTTASHQRSHVNIHQHSCHNIHNNVAANDNDFCLHFNDKLLHKK